MSYGPNPGDRDDMIAVLRGAVDRGVTLLRHRRGLRPVRQRGARRRGPRAGARPGGHRDEVRLAHRRTADGRARQPPRADPPGRRRVAAPARHRRDRPVLPAPRRPGRPHRGCRRARSATSSPAGKVRHFGLSEAGAGDDPPRPRRAPGHRRAERVLAVDPRPRAGGAADAAPSWASGSCRSARSARGSSPARSTVDHLRRRATSATASRGSPPRTATPTRRSSTTSAPSPTAKGATPGAGRARLAARPAAVDRADPRHAPDRARRGERRRDAPSRCPPTSAPTSTRSRRRVGVQGNRYDDTGMAMVGL